MSQSEYYSNNAKTSLTANYTAGSGTLVVANTAGNFPATAPFHVSVYDDSTVPPTLKVILEVTAITDSTHFAVTAEGTDANAATGCNVYQCLTKVSIDRIKIDAGTDTNLTLSDITTNNVSATKHGFAPKLPNDATKVLLGDGTYGTISGNPPWLSITDPSSISFSWRNQGSASVTARNKSIYLSAPAASGDNIKGREISAPATPWSITIGLVPHISGQNFNTSGLYVSDGTKLMTLAIQNSSTANVLAVQKYTSVTVWSSTPASPNTSWAISPVFLKVVDDGTLLKWYWSPNGTDFTLIFSEARLTWLASVSNVGFYANSNNASWPAGVVLMSWTQGTS